MTEAAPPDFQAINDSSITYRTENNATKTLTLNPEYEYTAEKSVVFMDDQQYLLQKGYKANIASVYKQQRASWFIPAPNDHDLGPVWQAWISPESENGHSRLMRYLPSTLEDSEQDKRAVRHLIRRHGARGSQRFDNFAFPSLGMPFASGASLSIESEVSMLIPIDAPATEGERIRFGSLNGHFPIEQGTPLEFKGRAEWFTSDAPSPQDGPSASKSVFCGFSCCGTKDE